MLLLWQIGLVGYTYMLAGHAAREGARELAIDTTRHQEGPPVPRRGEEDLPKAWRKGAKIDRPDDEHRARAR